MGESQVGISCVMKGVIHRACKSCGGVTHPDLVQRKWYHRWARRLPESSYVDNKCVCGAEPEVVLVNFTT